VVTLPLLSDGLMLVARECIAKAAAHRHRFALIESCTGGLASLAITALPGASEVFDGSIVPYSNDAKTRLSGRADVFVTHGSVSEEAATEMASAHLAASQVTHVVAATGISGPGGGTIEKPVGLVVFAAASANGEAMCFRQYFDPDLGRSGIMTEAARVMLISLRRMIEIYDIHT
jgi:nicotinamide-nucleotide amidase